MFILTRSEYSHSRKTGKVNIWAVLVKIGQAVLKSPWQAIYDSDKQRKREPHWGLDFAVTSNVKSVKLFLYHDFCAETILRPVCQTQRYQVINYLWRQASRPSGERKCNCKKVWGVQAKKCYRGNIPTFLFCFVLVFSFFSGFCFPALFAVSDTLCLTSRAFFYHVALFCVFSRTLAHDMGDENQWCLRLLSSWYHQLIDFVFQGGLPWANGELTCSSRRICVQDALQTVSSKVRIVMCLILL